MAYTFKYSSMSPLLRGKLMQQTGMMRMLEERAVTQDEALDEELFSYYVNGFVSRDTNGEPFALMPVEKPKKDGGTFWDYEKVMMSEPREPKRYPNQTDEDYDKSVARYEGRLAQYQRQQKAIEKGCPIYFAAKQQGMSYESYALGQDGQAFARALSFDANGNYTPQTAVLGNEHWGAKNLPTRYYVGHGNGAEGKDNNYNHFYPLCQFTDHIDGQQAVRDCDIMMYAYRHPNNVFPEAQDVFNRVRAYHSDKNMLVQFRTYKNLPEERKAAYLSQNSGWQQQFEQAGLLDNSGTVNEDVYHNVVQSIRQRGYLDHIPEKFPKTQAEADRYTDHLEVFRRAIAWSTDTPIPNGIPFEGGMTAQDAKKAGAARAFLQETGRDFSMKTDICPGQLTLVSGPISVRISDAYNSARKDDTCMITSDGLRKSKPVISPKYYAAVPKNMSNKQYIGRVHVSSSMTGDGYQYYVQTEGNANRSQILTDESDVRQLLSLAFGQDSRTTSTHERGSDSSVTYSESIPVSGGVEYVIQRDKNNRYVYTPIDTSRTDEYSKDAHKRLYMKQDDESYYTGKTFEGESKYMDALNYLRDTNTTAQNVFVQSVNYPEMERAAIEALYRRYEHDQILQEEYHGINQDGTLDEDEIAEAKKQVKETVNEQYPPIAPTYEGGEIGDCQEQYFERVKDFLRTDSSISGVFSEYLEQRYQAEHMSHTASDHAASENIIEQAESYRKIQIALQGDVSISDDASRERSEQNSFRWQAKREDLLLLFGGIKGSGKGSNALYLEQYNPEMISRFAFENMGSAATDSLLSAVRNVKQYRDTATLKDTDDEILDRPYIEIVGKGYRNENNELERQESFDVKKFRQSSISYNADASYSILEPVRPDRATAEELAEYQTKKEAYDKVVREHPFYAEVGAHIAERMRSTGMTPEDIRIDDKGIVYYDGHSAKSNKDEDRHLQGYIGQIFEPVPETDPEKGGMLKAFYGGNEKTLSETVTAKGNIRTTVVDTPVEPVYIAAGSVGIISTREADAYSQAPLYGYHFDENGKPECYQDDVKDAEGHVLIEKGTPIRYLNEHAGELRMYRRDENGKLMINEADGEPLRDSKTGEPLVDYAKVGYSEEAKALCHFGADGKPDKNSPLDAANPQDKDIMDRLIPATYVERMREISYKDAVMQELDFQIGVASVSCMHKTYKKLSREAAAKEGTDYKETNSVYINGQTTLNGVYRNLPTEIRTEDYWDDMQQKHAERFANTKRDSEEEADFQAACAVKKAQTTEMLKAMHDRKNAEVSMNASQSDMSDIFHKNARAANIEFIKEMAAKGVPMPASSYSEMDCLNGLGVMDRYVQSKYFDAYDTGSGARHALIISKVVGAETVRNPEQSMYLVDASGNPVAVKPEDYNVRPGKLMPGWSDTDALASLHFGRYGVNNPMDRYGLALANAQAALDINNGKAIVTGEGDERKVHNIGIGTVEANAGGGNQDDAIIVFKRFAQSSQVPVRGTMDEDTQKPVKRDLAMFDKLCYPDGNKGVISVVVDTDLNPSDVYNPYWAKPDEPVPDEDTSENARRVRNYQKYADKLEPPQRTYKEDKAYKALTSLNPMFADSNTVMANAKPIPAGYRDFINDYKWLRGEIGEAEKDLKQKNGSVDRTQLGTYQSSIEDSLSELVEKGRLSEKGQTRRKDLLKAYLDAGAPEIPSDEMLEAKKFKADVKAWDAMTPTQQRGRDFYAFLVDFGRENPMVDALTAPGTACSRFNIGGAMSKLEHNEQIRELNKQGVRIISFSDGKWMREDAEDDKSKLIDKIPTSITVNGKEIKGALAYDSIIVTDKTVDEKSHVYDEESSHGRNLSASAAVALQGMGAEHLMREYYENNDKAYQNLRDVYRMQGVGMREDTSLYIIDENTKLTDAKDPYHAEAHVGEKRNMISVCDMLTQADASGHTILYPKYATPDQIKKANVPAMFVKDSSQGVHLEIDEAHGIQSHHRTAEEEAMLNGQPSVHAVSMHLPASNKEKGKNCIPYEKGSGLPSVVLNYQSLKESFENAFANNGGDMLIPFPLELPAVKKVEGADGKTRDVHSMTPPYLDEHGEPVTDKFGNQLYRMPVASGAIRHSNETVDGKLQYHDLTERYFRIYKGVADFYKLQMQETILKQNEGAVRGAQTDFTVKGTKSSKNEVMKSGAAWQDDALKRVHDDLDSKKSAVQVQYDIMAKMAADKFLTDSKSNIYKNKLARASQTHSATLVIAPAPENDINEVTVGSQMAESMKLYDQPRTVLNEHTGQREVWREQYKTDGYNTSTKKMNLHDDYGNKVYCTGKKLATVNGYAEFCSQHADTDADMKKFHTERFIAIKEKGYDPALIGVARDGTVCYGKMEQMYERESEKIEQTMKDGSKVLVDKTDKDGNIIYKDGPALDADGNPIYAFNKDGSPKMRLVFDGKEPLTNKEKYMILKPDGEPKPDALTLVSWRDPMLSKGGIRSYDAEIIENNPKEFGYDPYNPRTGTQGMSLNPVAVAAMEGDFDGDTMGVTAPMKRESVVEARNLMGYEQNLMNMEVECQTAFTKDHAYDRPTVLCKYASGEILPEETGRDLYPKEIGTTVGFDTAYTRAAADFARDIATNSHAHDDASRSKDGTYYTGEKDVYSGVDDRYALYLNEHKLDIAAGIGQSRLQRAMEETWMKLCGKDENSDEYAKQFGHTGRTVDLEAMGAKATTLGNRAAVFATPEAKAAFLEERSQIFTEELLNSKDRVEMAMPSNDTMYKRIADNFYQDAYKKAVEEWENSGEGEKPVLDDAFKKTQRETKEFQMYFTPKRYAEQQENADKFVKDEIREQYVDEEYEKAVAEWENSGEGEKPEKNDAFKKAHPCPDDYITPERMYDKKQEILGDYIRLEAEKQKADENLYNSTLQKMRKEALDVTNDYMHQAHEMARFTNVLDYTNEETYMQSHLSIIKDGVMKGDITYTDENGVEQTVEVRVAGSGMKGSMKNLQNAALYAGCNFVNPEVDSVKDADGNEVRNIAITPTSAAGLENVTQIKDADGNVKNVVFCETKVTKDKDGKFVSEVKEQNTGSYYMDLALAKDKDGNYISCKDTKNVTLENGETVKVVDEETKLGGIGAVRADVNEHMQSSLAVVYKKQLTGVAGSATQKGQSVAMNSPIEDSLTLCDAADAVTHGVTQSNMQAKHLTATEAKHLAHHIMTVCPAVMKGQVIDRTADVVVPDFDKNGNISGMKTESLIIDRNGMVVDKDNDKMKPVMHVAGDDGKVQTYQTQFAEKQDANGNSHRVLVPVDGDGKEVDVTNLQGKASVGWEKAEKDYAGVTLSDVYADAAPEPAWKVRKDEKGKEIQATPEKWAEQVLDFYSSSDGLNIDMPNAEAVWKMAFRMSEPKELRRSDDGDYEENNHEKCIAPDANANYSVMTDGLWGKGNRLDRLFMMASEERCVAEGKAATAMMPDKVGSNVDAVYEELQKNLQNKTRADVYNSLYAMNGLKGIFAKDSVEEKPISKIEEWEQAKGGTESEKFAGNRLAEAIATLETRSNNTALTPEERDDASAMKQQAEDLQSYFKADVKALQDAESEEVGRVSAESYVRGNGQENVSNAYDKISDDDQPEKTEAANKQTSQQTSQQTEAANKQTSQQTEAANKQTSQQTSQQTEAAGRQTSQQTEAAGRQTSQQTNVKKDMPVVNKILPSNNPELFAEGTDLEAVNASYMRSMDAYKEIPVEQAKVKDATRDISNTEINRRLNKLIDMSRKDAVSSEAFRNDSANADKREPTLAERQSMLLQQVPKEDAVLVYTMLRREELQQQQSKSSNKTLSEIAAEGKTELQVPDVKGVSADMDLFANNNGVRSGYEFYEKAKDFYKTEIDFKKESGFDSTMGYYAAAGQLQCAKTQGQEQVDDALRKQNEVRQMVDFERRIAAENRVTIFDIAAETRRGCFNAYARNASGMTAEERNHFMKTSKEMLASEENSVKDNSVTIPSGYKYYLAQRDAVNKEMTKDADAVSIARDYAAQAYPSQQTAALSNQRTEQQQANMYEDTRNAMRNSLPQDNPEQQTSNPAYGS